ncbi:hypothetical protein CHUAL_012895 [Chamberlinius hualienensis]
MVLSMPQMSLQYANRPIAVFRRIFSLPFWLALILRVVSSLWFVFRFHSWWASSDNQNGSINWSDFEDGDDDEQESRLGRLKAWIPNFLKTSKNYTDISWTFSLYVILAAIFVYTQLIVVHLSRHLPDCDNSVEICSSWSIPATLFNDVTLKLYRNDGFIRRKKAYVMKGCDRHNAYSKTTSGSSTL